MNEIFNYKTLGPEQTTQILSAYIKVQSCLAASMQEGVFVSPATVSRVINAAIEEGEVDPEIKRQSGRPKNKRKEAMRIVQKYPIERGYSRKQQAATAGGAQATIYRALNELNDLE